MTSNSSQASNQAGPERLDDCDYQCLSFWVLPNQVHDVADENSGALRHAQDAAEQ